MLCLTAYIRGRGCEGGQWLRVICVREFGGLRMHALEFKLRCRDPVGNVFDIKCPLAFMRCDFDVFGTVVRDKLAKADDGVSIVGFHTTSEPAGTTTRHAKNTLLRQLISLTAVGQQTSHLILLPWTSLVQTASDTCDFRVCDRLLVTSYIHCRLALTHTHTQAEFQASLPSMSLNLSSCPKTVFSLVSRAAPSPPLISTDATHSSAAAIVPVPLAHIRPVGVTTPSVRAPPASSGGGVQDWKLGITQNQRHALVVKMYVVMCVRYRE